jgi:two-component sensor histidine kinase
MFEGRLLALAAAHDVLTRESWEGAELHAIIVEALAPYCDRFDLDGPELRLQPRMALALSMALHELCTNAAKYGSLSAPKGRVVIGWSISPQTQQLTLRWQEKYGPPVAPPQRRGFGTRLIQQSLALELGGEVSLSFARDGVICEVRAPFEGGITTGGGPM